ncbi:MAG TPA: V-type ATP synthase subunit D [Streptosporangiaceae bacterium]|nr:V-type ATP synthase subunit D [Streptosporangiaceae bacterium]
MTGGMPGVPPGRAGRLWLRRRLETARRGSALLDRKLHLLLTEQDRLRAEEKQTRQEWDASCAKADLWLLRAELLSGRRAITLAASRLPAEVTIRYGLTAGTRYPSGITCTTPEPDTFDGPALAAARQAYKAAVASAASHAAAAEAVRIIDTDVGATRYRLRAIEERWIPRLERTLTQVELGLEELEHADGVRLRHVLSHRGDSAGTRPS